MDFFNMPDMIKMTSPEEISAKMEALRQPDRGWIEQQSYACSLDDFELKKSQNRYTIECEGVPFECLFLPQKSKKLYVLLSGNRNANNRQYPLFLRWKYKNVLDGNLLCIDDPMYYFHTDYTHVMWYYGTNNTSYLLFLVSIVKKFMNQLSVEAENVTFVGSSGGGYSALYCANKLDYSSAIAMNPQFVLKDWYSPVVYESFKKIGIDLALDDRFGRNRLHLANKKSTFMVVMNASSLDEYEQQFTPFFESHDITPRYGISQTNNIITWIHTTKYSKPHSVFPLQSGVAYANFLLDKAKVGVDINSYYGFSLLANEVLHDEYDLKDKLEKSELEKSELYKFFVSNISSIVKKNLSEKITCRTSEKLKKFLENNYECSTVVWKNTNIGYYIGGQRNYRYNVAYIYGKFHIRMLFDYATDYLDRIDELKEYLAKHCGLTITQWRLSQANSLIISLALVPEKVEVQIGEFIDLTINILSGHIK